MSQHCTVLPGEMEKPVKSLTSAVSPPPAFFCLMESNVENLKIWGNAEKTLYVKYNLQNKTWKFLE